ncbi:hypothetical protein CC80DRAFT_248164 [Byssothecium circinans]|uniref:Uncharacterized protein n=1 Tax=Byssothecium circinans TaxID=147558 RepID=A0A6A5TAS4_9PLEO|nr:hypothetical protein CC80DRAFT_248164 [Byssothecium circinans]
MVIAGYITGCRLVQNILSGCVVCPWSLFAAGGLVFLRPPELFFFIESLRLLLGWGLRKEVFRLVSNALCLLKTAFMSCPSPHLRVLLSNMSTARRLHVRRRRSAQQLLTRIITSRSWVSIQIPF